jgi:hypothetical protein
MLHTYTQLGEADIGGVKLYVDNKRELLFHKKTFIFVIVNQTEDKDSQTIAYLGGL